MKYYILLFIGIIILVILPIPNYVELNYLVLIDSIDITCNNNKYSVSVKEIIPQKEGNRLYYEYEFYEEEGDDLLRIFNSLEEEHFLYFRKAHIKVQNCINKDEITALMKKRK